MWSMGKRERLGRARYNVVGLPWYNDHMATESKWEMWQDDRGDRATHLRLVVHEADLRRWSRRQLDDLAFAGLLIEQAFTPDEEIVPDEPWTSRPRRLSEMSPDELRAVFEKLGAVGHGA